MGVEVQPFIEEYLQKPLYDNDGVQVQSAIGTDGREYPDPVPMSPPIGYTPPNDLMTMIQTMIKSELVKNVLHDLEADTEEEANDFDIEDDPVDALTPYERVFEPAGDPPGRVPPAAPAAPLSPSGSPAAGAPSSPSAPLPAPGNATSSALSPAPTAAAAPASSGPAPSSTG